jgi:hypothetical protein
MAAPLSAQQAGQNPVILYGSLVTLLVVGSVLTFVSYRLHQNRPTAA